LSPSMIEQLMDVDAWPHPVESVELHETHISWVLLAGDYAYKIRKPVRFGFVDFSTLKQRQHDCEVEYQLNFAYSPEIYLGVVEIREDDEGRLGVDSSTGKVIEYAVRMRRFDQDALFSRQLTHGVLDVYRVELLAERVADIHRVANRASVDTDFGQSIQVRFWNDENLEQIQAIVTTGPSSARVNAIASRVRVLFESCRESIDVRHHDGWVRDCHGDLHLGNVLWLDDKVVLFDRLEFNESLRWIDVINDIAFTAMDLGHGGRSDLAWRFVNRYLMHTGDYEGVRVLRFYMVYRALVRAKVALLSSDAREKAAAGLVSAFESHLSLAQTLLDEMHPELTITCGLSGSGKTTRALELASRQGAIVVHTDVERKRMAQLGAYESSGAELDEGIYSQSMSERVYARLAEVAGAILDAGFPAVVDGAFLRRADREQFRAIASAHGVPFSIAYCNVEVDELRRRIIARQQTPSVSEATLEVLEHQLQSAELPDESELIDSLPATDPSHARDTPG
jgi:uncharacterized protein